jgi:hypothetical protein
LARGVPWVATSPPAAGSRFCGRAWFIACSRRFGIPPSKPAAITVTRTSSPSASSITAPKMMFASVCADSETS